MPNAERRTKFEGRNRVVIYLNNRQRTRIDANQSRNLGCFGLAPVSIRVHSRWTLIVTKYPQRHETTTPGRGPRPSPNLHFSPYLSADGARRFFFGIPEHLASLRADRVAKIMVAASFSGFYLLPDRKSTRL